MSIGTIETSVLTDIANAIRYQAGVATTYRPSQMAAAVAALDGTDAGGYVPQQYKQLQSGILSSSVYDDIADAIRAQNGSQATYEPGDMAQAILDLTWDTGIKARAMLLTDGTLELNYRDGRSSDVGTISKCWEVDTSGYSSAAARPWDADRLQVTRVVIDSDFANAGMTNFAYFFNAMANLVEVTGFEALSGMTNAAQMFVSCPKLETIYATSFDNTALATFTLMFSGCNRLVGGTDGFVPSSTSAGSVCRLGAGGVLTDPSDDARTWFWAHFYSDGGAVLTATPTPDASRTLLASNRICAIGKYQAMGFTPWDGGSATHRQNLTSAAFAADMATFSYLNLNYLFYSCTNLASVSGLANLRGVRSMRYTFSSCAFTTLDLRGFDPSTLADLFYTFSGCSSLVTIYADSTWALPTSGVMGSQCFYNCRSLVGGNGTAWSSSNTGYTYMRIDKTGQAGYLTAA